MKKYVLIGVVTILAIGGGWWYVNQLSVPRVSETTYAVLHDQTKNFCEGNIPQRLVSTMRNQDGVQETVHLSTDLVSSLKNVGIQTDSKQEWHILSSSTQEGYVFLYASSPCSEKGLMDGPAASFNLNTGVFKELKTPFTEFHWLDPRVVSPDGTKLLVAIVTDYPSEEAEGTLRVIDLVNDTFSTLATIPKGTHLASWCVIACENYLLRWIDNDTVEYGIYNTDEPTEESKTPREVRRVDLQ